MIRTAQNSTQDKSGTPFVLTWPFRTVMSHSNMFSSAPQIILITRKLEALNFSCHHDRIPSGLHHLAKVVQVHHGYFELDINRLLIRYITVQWRGN